MKVYFFRHGEADWPNWEGSDDERPLTKKGKKEVKRVAEFLADLDVEPDVLLSSPLPRALETAEIAAQALDLEVTTEPALAPGFNVEQLGELLRKYQDQDVVLVGHEPSLSQGIAALTGGNIKLAKAGVARVDVDNPNDLHGQLIWLVPPKISTS